MIGEPSSVGETAFQFWPSLVVRQTRLEPANTVPGVVGLIATNAIQIEFFSSSVAGGETSSAVLPRKRIDVQVVVRREQVTRVAGIERNPAAVATEDFEVIVEAARRRDERAVVLGSAAIHARITLGDVHVVVHRDGEAVAAVRPIEATVVADVDTAIVTIVDPAGH